MSDPTRVFEHYQVMEAGAIRIQDEGVVIGRTSTTVTLRNSRNHVYCVERERVIEGRRKK